MRRGAEACFCSERREELLEAMQNHAEHFVETGSFPWFYVESSQRRARVQCVVASGASDEKVLRALGRARGYSVRPLGGTSTVPHYG